MRAHAFEGVCTVVGRSLGDRTLDIQRLRQGFSAAVRIQQLVDTTRHDLGFLAAVRRGLMPLPTDRRSTPPTRVFPPLEPLEVPLLAGRRIGLIATGGSGVLASVVGVVRALEEAGLRPDVLSLCSGSALFGFPIAAGLTAEDAANAAARLHPPDYVQLSAAPLARSLVSAGRGFGGFLRGERIEAIYRELLGDRRLGDLEIPAYVVVWNVERDRLEYLGPRTRPDLPVATAVRLAISLPLMIEGAELDGEHWFDGGVVDIFPVRPVLDLEPPCDVVFGVNGFYPPRFAGHDVTGWLDRPLSIMGLAGQTRTMQHAHIARLNLERLERNTELHLLDPVAASEADGLGLYRHFLDTTRWPEFMLAGRSAMRATLLQLAERSHAT